MPYTNDMATLADVVSPVDAAMQAGQQSGYSNIQDAIKTQIQQATMPQEIQKASLANALTQAQAYNEQGIGMQNTAKGIQDIYATPSATQAAIVGNQTKVSSDQLTKLNNLGAIVGNVANYMEGVPPPARPAAMQQFLKQQGIQDPGIIQAVSSGDPDILRNISQKIIQSSADYQTKYMQEQAGTERTLGAATISSEGRAAAAAEAARARVQAAEVAAKARQQAEGFEQAAVQAHLRGDDATAQKFYQAAVNIRQWSAQTTQSLVGVTLPTPGFEGQPGVNVGGGGGGQQQQQPVPTAQGTTVVNGMEYRQLPDGTWQSRKAQ